MEPVSARPLTRRRTLLGLGGAGVVGALGLTGCSSAPTSSAQQTSPSAAASPSSSAPSAADSTGVFDGEDMERTLVVVPFGTRLPLLEQGEKASRVLLPNEREGWIAAADMTVGEPALGTVEQVFETARSFDGTPYLWGGISPFGIDCSGFTYTVLRSHGILLPRDAGPQLNHSGLPTVSADDLTLGDLLFYSLVPGGERIRHVALYPGEGYGIHAPFVGRPVCIETPAQINVKRDYAGAVRPTYATA